jgi:glycosyltransferase involved in cell wall biosynthesis
MNVNQPLPISVCIIAGNEAARIRPALESVANWTGEIIIVLNDTVNDGTDKIAETFGAKIFRESWKGYVAQKNSANDKARLDWILSLDADEVVSSNLKTDIFNIFADAAKLSSISAFSFPRCTFYSRRWIRHGDWYPDRKIRLWKKDQARWVGEKVHETVEVTGVTQKLKGDLLHYSMDDLNHHVRKTLVYSDMFVVQKRGRNISVPEIWFRSWWRFMRGYFFRFGFLDGWQGYTIARITAFETFLRYVKLRETQAKDNQPS